MSAFFFQSGDNWASSHVASFSGMDPSYVLPDNVALLTLQVIFHGDALLQFKKMLEKNVYVCVHKFQELNISPF